MIKVLIVDDSAFMRKLIGEMLEKEKDIEVVGKARDGEDAIAKVKRFNPDVVTMDVEMPKMDGLESLEHIMRVQPTPVVMLSSTTEEGAENTLKAMELGAIDFVAKPSGAISFDLVKVESHLIKKIRVAAKANVTNVKKVKEEFESGHIEEKTFKVKSGNRKLTLIGVSTGGPRALQRIIPEIKKNIDSPILIVQHMPKGYTKSLAERLNKSSDIVVKEAEDNEPLQNGVAYIAPGGFHLEVSQKGERFYASINRKDPVKGHRPCVDRLFYSASQLKNCTKIAILLTGMGRDGTEGAKMLRKKGDLYTIAESEETCVVYGMPRSLVESKNADEILMLDKIASRINQLF